MPPGLPTLQDAKEIAFTFDTCASHVVAWGVSAAASGALAEDWLSLPADEHASAPGGVARVVVAWLLSVPLFEFLCAAARFGPAAPAAPAITRSPLPTFQARSRGPQHRPHRRRHLAHRRRDQLPRRLRGDPRDDGVVEEVAPGCDPPLTMT